MRQTRTINPFKFPTIEGGTAYLFCLNGETKIGDIVTNLATVIRRSFFRKVSIIFFEKISVLAVEPYRFFSNVDKAFAYSYKIQAQINNSLIQLPSKSKL